MAITPLTLKANTFLTLEDAKDWLNIKPANTEHDNRLTRIINMATDLCEKYIGGPIKSRSYTEYKSGDSSNTIVPSYWPVQSVEQLKIDYNRSFGNETILPADQFVLDGPAKYLEIGIMGQDIVLRSENDSSIIGKIFNGSVVGSIKLDYTAGWGADQSTIPNDLVHAVMITIEYYYILRENRELNVRAKTNTGQVYNRDVGLPKEAVEILDRYVDVTLGPVNLPQKNTFST